MNEHPTSTEMGRGRGTAPFPGAPSPKTNLGRLHKTLDTPCQNENQYPTQSLHDHFAPSAVHPTPESIRCQCWSRYVDHTCEATTDDLPCYIGSSVCHPLPLLTSETLRDSSQLAKPGILQQRSESAPIRGSGKFILLDKGPCWAQGCRHDVGGFFLARPVFPSQALFSYHRCKANVPLPREGNSTCSLLPSFNRRIADGAETRYSRDTLRRRQHSNK